MAVLVNKTAPFFADDDKSSPPCSATARSLTISASRLQRPANTPWCSSTRSTSPSYARPELIAFDHRLKSSRAQCRSDRCVDRQPVLPQTPGATPRSTVAASARSAIRWWPTSTTTSARPMTWKAKAAYSRLVPDRQVGRGTAPGCQQPAAGPQHRRNDPHGRRPAVLQRKRRSLPASAGWNKGKKGMKASTAGVAEYPLKTPANCNRLPDPSVRKPAETGGLLHAHLFPRHALRANMTGLSITLALRG